MRTGLLVGGAPKLRIAGKTMLGIIGLFNPIMREPVENERRGLRLTYKAYAASFRTNKRV